MFKVGDIIRQKPAKGEDNKVYYALVVHIQYNRYSPDISLSRIKVQWLNWEREGVTLYQSEALKWWEKVE